MTALDTQPQLSTSLDIGYDKRLMLFSGRANPELGHKIADNLGVGLGPVDIKTFSNGEVYCRYLESIRGADVFIVQPTCANPSTGITPNDSLMELLFLIDAAVGGGADRRVDHDQQLHQSVVGVDPGVGIPAGRLDDEDVGAADGLLVAAVDLAVGEGLERHPAEPQPELLCDLAGQLRVRPSGEEHQLLAVLEVERGRGHRSGAGDRRTHGWRECTPSRGRGIRDHDRSSSCRRRST